MELFHHEQIYRGKATLDKLFGNTNNLYSGNIKNPVAENTCLLSPDVAVSPHLGVDIMKLDPVLIDYRQMSKELDSKTKFKRFVKERVSLVVDAFDNSKSRQLVKNFCLEQILDCVHIGFSGDYGEIVWNEDYRVPDEQGEDDHRKILYFI